jgi:tripartite-type tricarboxylate transporter receptor subunit TctC
MTRLCALALLLAAGTAALAQGYPDRPVRLVVPFAAGGLVDVPARLLAQRLTTALGQPLIVDNRAGAGSTLGADAVAKSRADGYTLLVTSTTHVISANLYRNLPYDALRDFTPVMKLAEGPYVLVVNPALEATTVRELIALAKARPGRIDYGSSGNGSSQHLAAALFCALSGATLNHVPYKGSDRATQDLVGGQVQVGFLGTPGALPQLKSGRLRALAVTTAKRSPELPEVPTLQEAGVAGYEATIWLGLFAPARLPPAIAGKLRAEVTRALGAPEARASIAATGLEVDFGDGEDFPGFVRAEHAKWGKVVRDTGAAIN